MVTFAVYTASQPDHTLRPGVAFVALSLFDLLKAPLNSFPRCVSYLIMVRLSLRSYSCQKQRRCRDMSYVITSCFSVLSLSKELKTSSRILIWIPAMSLIISELVSLPYMLKVIPMSNTNHSKVMRCRCCSLHI